MTARLLLLLGLMFAVAFSGPALAAGDRIALVIGNAKYPDAEAPLKEPINDARDLTDELKRDGFTVETLENATGEAMRRGLERLYGSIKPGSVALVFFSGFGIQSNRTSYMIPVDAQIWQEADVRRDGISLEQVLQEINSRGAGVKIALLDASRRNPYERRFRTASSGLAPCCSRPAEWAARRLRPARRRSLRRARMRSTAPARCARRGSRRPGCGSASPPRSDRERGFPSRAPARTGCGRGPYRTRPPTAPPST